MILLIAIKENSMSCIHPSLSMQMGLITMVSIILHSSCFQKSFEKLSNNELLYIYLKLFFTKLTKIYLLKKMKAKFKCVLLSGGRLLCICHIE